MSSLSPNPNQTPTSQPSQQTLRKQYRNGTYIGNISSTTRNGLGLLIMDNGQLLFGNWQNNDVLGECLYLSKEMRLFGKIGHRGLLEGFHVWTLMDVAVGGAVGKGEAGVERISMSLYGHFKDNRLFGRFVAVIKQTIYLCNTGSQQQLEIIKKVKNSSKHSLTQILTLTFPYIHTIQLHNYLTKLLEKSSNPTLSKYYPTVQPYPMTKSSSFFTSSEDNKIFYGFTTHRSYNKDKCREFGFVLYNEELLSVGEHRYGEAHGLGTVFQYKGCIHDGVFFNGHAQGLGVRYQPETNRYTYGKYRDEMPYSTNTRKFNTGKFDGVETISEGANWPNKIIKEYRKQIHIRSIYFNSECAEISIAFPLNDLNKIYKYLISAQTTQQTQNSNYFTVSPIQNRRRYTEASPNQKISSRNTSNSPNIFGRFRQRSFVKNNQPNLSAKGEGKQSEYKSTYNYNLSDKKNVSPFIYSFDEKADRTGNKDQSSRYKQVGEQKFDRSRQSRANTVFSMFGEFKK